MNALYRGKRIDTGEWAYGMPHSYKGATYIASENLKVICGMIDDDFALDNWWRVDPATVGQYTGLKDKNGVKIFQGDIIRFENGNYGYGDPSQPEYRTDIVPEITKLYGSEPEWDGYLAHSDGSDCEVIGNIHDKEASQ